MTHQGYPKGASSRTRVLDITLAYIAEHGYRDTTLRAIAASAGMSVGGLMHHFPSKEHLLVAVLGRRDELADIDVIADADADGQDAALLAPLVALMAANSKEPRIIELHAAMSAASSDPDHPAHHFMKQRFERITAEAATAIEELRDAGRVEPGVDAAVASRNLIAIMDGIQVQWLLDPGIDMAAHVAAYLHTLAPAGAS